jgi:hypothetical protein
MAQRANRKIVKIDDVQRTLDLQTASTSVGTMTIQIPDMLMRANRRQYQQARCYSFRLKGLNTGTATARNYEIYTLSNAWWVKKSIEYAKGVYLHSTKEERSLVGSGAGKWNDFIITGSEIGAAANHSNLYQYSPATSGDDMTAAEVATDETLYESQAAGSDVEGDQDLGAEVSYGFTIAATDTTGSVRSYNIFDQYLLSRDTSNPAIAAANGPYRDLLEIDHVAINDMKQDGDLAPFDVDAFPSPWVKQDVVLCDAEGSGENKFTRFMDAPLGIVIIKKKGNDGTTEVNLVANEGVILEVRSGRYKGVHAPAYKATKMLTD